MSGETATPVTSHLLPNVLRFGRLLRRLGVPVDPNQLAAFSEALGHVDLRRRPDVREAARTTLATRRAELPLLDLAFETFWSAEHPAPDAGARRDLGRLLQRAPETRRDSAPARAGSLLRSAVPSSPKGVSAGEPRRGFTSREELRHRDFARLTPEERRRVERIIAERPWRIPLRRTRRLRPGRGRRPDLRRTLREALRHGGEPVRLARLERKRKVRPLVVLCDVSGSMKLYSRLLLQFVYAIGRGRAGVGSAGGRRAGPVEVFAFGTRLTRITRALEERDVDAALSHVSDAVLDWDGGTRIGESLRAFNYRWARRVLRRGAVVLVISDGWDRGDVELLEREVARLQRSCHRLLWLNPLIGSPGYVPATPAIRAVLRHADAFLPVRDLSSLEQLCDVLAGLDGGRGKLTGPARRMNTERQSARRELLITTREQA